MSIKFNVRLYDKGGAGIAQSTTSDYATGWPIGGSGLHSQHKQEILLIIASATVQRSAQIPEAVSQWGVKLITHLHRMHL
jgi:hypothetical protein